MKLTEEHGFYTIDCSNAVWATDSHHDLFHKTTYFLSDVDWIIETEDRIMLVEYKNGTVSSKSKFDPKDDKPINKVVKKYYDTLHYINLLNKNKPKYYIYVLEYPNGDSSSRKGIRNKIAKLLPFKLQKEVSSEIKIIDSFEVLSIDEWNKKYSNFLIERTDKPIT